MIDDARWFAGIDWATEMHQVCLLDATGNILGERAFAHGGGGLAELCAWLLAHSGADAGGIAVAIEVPHGRALRSLGDRLLAVACAMLTRQTFFDPHYASPRNPAAA